MVDLIIPIGQKVALAYNPSDIPVALRGKVQAALPTRQDIEDLPHALGGRDVKPPGPILLWAPDGMQIMIMGHGYASASEIQDLAYAALDKAEVNAKKLGRSFNFDEARTKNGLPRRENVDPMIRDALRRRAAQHKANPITDPARKVRYR